MAKILSLRLNFSKNKIDLQFKNFQKNVGQSFQKWNHNIIILFIPKNISDEKVFNINLPFQVFFKHFAFRDFSQFLETL